MTMLDLQLDGVILNYMYTDEKIISYASELNIGDLVNVYQNEYLIFENCVILETIQDHYFNEGLVVYLHKEEKKVIDLGDMEGFYIKKHRYL